MKTSTVIDRQATILSLLKSHTEDNFEALEIADKLKTLLMLKDYQQKCIKNSYEYIGSEDFHTGCATMDAIKIQITQLILKF